MTESYKEYAVALFSLAQEENKGEEILNGLKLISEVFKQTPELYGFIKTPAVSKAQRINAVKQAFGDTVCEYALSFLLLLCEKGNADVFTLVADEYEAIYTNSRKIRRARVTSAYPLNEEQKQKLSQKLSLGGNVIIEYVTDTSIIGGITVEVDGGIIDGSIKRRLHNLKEELEK